MKPLHEELRELREEQNLTLKDIAGKTRIRFDFLERLEAGDYTVAPMPFVRAFFREYAEVVGIDATLAMAKMDKKIDTILVPKPADESELEPVAQAEPKSDDDAYSSEPVREMDETEPVAVTEEDTTVVDTAMTAEDVETEDTQASLFEDTETAEEDTEDELFDDAETIVEKESSPGDESVSEQAEASAEEPTAADIPDDSAESDTVEPVTVCDGMPDTDQTTVPDTYDTTVERVEIEIDENGKPPEHVRRPLVIEEENSLSNIVFTVIVVAILIIAGVLVFLHRGTLF